MRIAFLCGFAWAPKGTVRLRAFPIATELVRRGHAVTIFLAPYDHPSDSSRVWCDEGVRIFNVGIPVQRFRWPEIIFSLAKAVRAFRPDILHVFKPKGFAGAATELLLAITKRPFFLDCDDWEGWGGWNDAKPYPALVKQFIAWEERRLIARAEAVSVASQALYSRIASIRNGYSGIEYLPNCVSRKILETVNRVRSFDRQLLRAELQLPNQPLILYAGHYEAAVDVMFFARAGAGCVGLTLIFAGDGAELPKVRDFFAARPEVDVRFFGNLPYMTYLKLLWACDIAAFPYPDNLLYRAKCSVRILEFMAMGKPVVGTSVGQNSIYIQDGVNGRLVAAGDKSAFVNALNELAQNASLRQRMGSAARRSILECFIWDEQTSVLCERMYTTVKPQSDVFAVRS